MNFTLNSCVSNTSNTYEGCKFDRFHYRHAWQAKDPSQSVGGKKWRRLPNLAVFQLFTETVKTGWREREMEFFVRFRHPGFVSYLFLVSCVSLVVLASNYFPFENLQNSEIR